MNKSKLIEKYDELFPNDFEKARAFDAIAEKYYLSNFGSLSKSDIDVLMFSLYIDRILKKDNKNFQSYSDYTLSKYLGITQTKISNLKVKKELVYPYEGFDWRESFLSIADKAVYEKGYIKLYIPDRNLFLEIQNAIESGNGIMEITLNPKLLQVKLESFLDLMVALCDEKDRKSIMKEIRKKLKNDSSDADYIENGPLGLRLAKETAKPAMDLILSCIPAFKGIEVVGNIASTIIETVKNLI